MSTLSVLCITRDPGPQIAAILAPLRAVATEIVVVADDRVGPEDLAHYASVADRVVRYPFALPVERPYAWAHAQCTGDWVLRIDGDEYPSAELVEALPALIAREDRLHFWLRRSWCYPDPSHWLDERPWAPDFQLRLVRRDPATLTFDGLMHTAARQVEPYELLDAPLYHLDLLLQPLERRQEKVAVYEELRPGMSVSGGGPMMLLYLPEAWAALEPRPVAAEDAPALAAAVEAAAPAPADAAGDRPAPVDPDAISLATREEIDAHWDGRPLRDEDYAAEITSVETDVRMMPGRHDEVTVRVRNTGGATWPGGVVAEPPILLGHRWWDEDGLLVEDIGRRVGFPSRVAPGQAVIVRVPVVGPAERGRYVLELDVVHEGVRWFEQSLSLPVVVAERAPARELDRPQPAEDADETDRWAWLGRPSGPLPTAEPASETPASEPAVEPQPTAEGPAPARLQAAEVEMVYREFLGRQPRKDEVDHQLESAPDLHAVMVGITASAEHRRRQDALSAGLKARATGRFVENLRLLNDVIARTPLAGHYWIWGGLLIGYAREGWPLAHDSGDADFCVRIEHLPEFLVAAEALIEAGFKPSHRFFRNDRRVTEFSFVREDAKFEFFVLEPVDDTLRYYDINDGHYDDTPVQALAQIPAQPLVAVDFIGRTWHKHADHDAELTYMYGDWRTPDPDWDYMNDQAIVSREPWTRGADRAWDGTLTDLDAEWKRI